MESGTPAIAYYRVSTARQGRSGLGLQAQCAAVEEFARSSGVRVLMEFKEVETGTTKRERPVLDEAISRCKLTGATLVIAKLDRLSRNVAVISSLMESGVEFVALDAPHATRFTLHILAAVAEHETRMISDRTKSALAAARKRGTKLGNPQGARALLAYGKGHKLGGEATKAAADTRADNLKAVLLPLLVKPLRAIADTLNAQGIKSARGGQWHSSAVLRTIQRLGLQQGTATDQ